MKISKFSRQYIKSDDDILYKCQNDHKDILKKIGLAVLLVFFFAVIFVLYLDVPIWEILDTEKMMVILKNENGSNYFDATLDVYGLHESFIFIDEIIQLHKTPVILFLVEGLFYGLFYVIFGLAVGGRAIMLSALFAFSKLFGINAGIWVMRVLIVGWHILIYMEGYAALYGFCQNFSLIAHDSKREVIVTRQFLIYKIGRSGKKSKIIPLKNIDSAVLVGTIFEQHINYNDHSTFVDVVIRGSGFDGITVDYIKNPSEFRNAVNDAASAAKAQVEET